MKYSTPNTDVGHPKNWPNSTLEGRKEEMQVQVRLH